LDGKAWSFEADEAGQEFFKIKADLLDSAIADKVNYMNTLSQKIAKDGEFRGQLTSELVNHAVNGVYIKVDEENPSQYKVGLNPETKVRVEVLKNFNYESQIQSPRLKVAEYRGKQIVKDIFTALSEKDGWMLLPEDYQLRFKSGKEGF